MGQKIISQGAEAKIILKGNSIIKDRVKKSYRHPKLDEKIRKLRTRSESKILEKVSGLIQSPKVFEANDKKGKIEMEFIKGKKLSENLDLFQLKKQKNICEKIGENIAKIHDKDIIHGDLTTSNMIYNEKQKEVFFIDFGLGYISRKIEDKSVDLHLLRQALEAKHFKNWEALFESVLKGYKSSENFKKVLERLKAVEKRGRYKKNY